MNAYATRLGVCARARKLELHVDSRKWSFMTTLKILSLGSVERLHLVATKSEPMVPSSILHPVTAVSE